VLAEEGKNTNGGKKGEDTEGQQLIGTLLFFVAALID
jgi:hypothetical protein